MNQNCTIDDKKHDDHQIPKAGNRVTMYANSLIIGSLIVGDNVVPGAKVVCVRIRKRTEPMLGLMRKGSEDVSCSTD